MTLVRAALLLPVVAVAAASASAGTSAGACSASGLTAVKPVSGLPKPVASMRARVADAARRCDYAGLERLANEHGKGLEFSFGASRSATAYWRGLERNGPRPKPMEALVRILKLPFVVENGFYNWPSAFQRRPKERDWQALRGLYTSGQIASMRRSGIGYFGYRAGFKPNGDWVFFVSGD